MKPLRFVASLVIVLTAVAPFLADTRKNDLPVDDNFVPMFNGKDLTGWVNVNCAPGTFFVKDGEIITTGKPTGYLRTQKQYQNFIADFEWMHVNKKEVGNSGFFVWADPLPAVGTPYTRGIEVQVLVNLEKEGYYTSQGDLFSIWGATCKPDRPHPHGWARCLPSENRTKGGGEWNHYQVIADDGVLKLHVNGKEVSGLSKCKPCKGYLALESEGAECHFRNLKIKELPASPQGPGDAADVAQDFKNLYTGLDLSGWKADEDTKKHWQPRDWVLHFDGKAKDELATEKEYGDVELITDFRFIKPCKFAVVVRESKDCKFAEVLNADNDIRGLRYTSKRGTDSLEAHGKAQLKPTGEWNRLHITLQGGRVSIFINGERDGNYDLAGISDLLKLAVPVKSVLALQPEGEMELGNLFVRERKK
jgi:hypothetical protein